MGESVHASVVDQYGSLLRAMPNGFVTGGRVRRLAGSGDPTLTIVALALGTADLIGDRIG